MIFIHILLYGVFLFFIMFPFKKLSFLSFAIAAILGLCWNPSIGFAQSSPQKVKITPSHVYQSTEELRLKLQAFGLLDMQTYELVKPDTVLRHPRHVIQKVRECHQLFSKILLARNIEPEPLPDLYSLREVRPSDVKNGVGHLVREIEKLGQTESIEVPFIENKLPDDVYNNLKRICRAVTVDIVPADVYQVAAAVRVNTEKIANNRGYKLDIKEKKFTSKIPADVYQETWLFLDDLRLLALNPDFAIPGGVIMPNKQDKDDIEPHDVIALMNNALSGTNAIKYTLGVREKTDLPGFEKDKTPSDVFREIHHAHIIVKRLIELETELDREDSE